MGDSYKWDSRGGAGRESVDIFVDLTKVREMSTELCGAGVLQAERAPSTGARLKGRSGLVEEHIVFEWRGHPRCYLGILCVSLLQQGPWNLHGGGETHCICGWFCGESQQVDLCESFENQVRTKGVYSFPCGIPVAQSGLSRHAVPPTPTCLPCLSAALRCGTCVGDWGGGWASKVCPHYLTSPNLFYPSVKRG